jgi:hypothetical protein
MGFTKKTGEFHRSQLAKRLGIDNSCLSKSNWGGPKMQLRNFLVTLAVCNIDWNEVEFPPPVLAVLESLQQIFPKLSDRAGLGFNCETPSIEELLVLYFGFNLPAIAPTHQVLVVDVEHALGDDAIDWLTDQVKSVEWTRQIDIDCEAVAIVPRPQVVSREEIIQTLHTYGATWSLMREIFPFLISQIPDKSMRSWEAGWGLL